MKKVILAVLLLASLPFSAFATSLEDQYTVKKYGPYPLGVIMLKYSPDGKSFAYVASKKNGSKNDFILVKDDVIISTKPDVLAGFSYAPDGKGFAFLEYDPISKKNTLIKDGIKSDPYDSLWNLTYSPDGKELSFVWIIGEERFVFKNGIRIGPYKSVGRLSYSPDGKSFAYVARDEKWEFVVKDGVKWDTYDSINSTDLYNPDSLGATWWTSTYISYSPDWKSFVYVAKKNGKALIVKDGIENHDYDESFNPIYSPDWKSFAYIAKKDGKTVVIKDGIASGPYNGNVLRLTYSPDGRDFFFIVANSNEGTFVAMKNGIPQNRSSLYKLTTSPIFSSDGKSSAFLEWESEKKGFVVKDGISYGSYERIDGLWYIPQSNTLVWSAVTHGDNHSYIFIDGKKLERYYSNWEFETAPDGSFMFGAYTDIDTNYLISYSKKSTVVTKSETSTGTTESSSTQLSEKQVKSVQNLATKINKMYLSKRLKYRNQLNSMLTKQKPGTANYEIIRSLIEQIKKN